MIQILTREKAVKKAQTAVLNDYGRENRNWISAHVDCYTSPHYRTEVFVLEGSPARGYVLDMGSGYSGVVLALDLNGRVLKTVEYGC